MLKPSAIVGSAFLLLSIVVSTDTCPAQGGVTWTQLSPAGPSAWSEHAMAYDAARERVVLFGGYGGIGRHQDTWEWDGANWMQATPAQSPTARGFHAMAYDAARHRVVLFGGRDASRHLQDDTWLWDGVNWTQAAPAQSPSARAGHAMAYDAARQRVVLFGGSGADTWEWDGVNWTQAAPAQSPSARAGHAMAYDAARQRVVLFGGSGADTWEWDGVNWTQATPTQSPSERYGHAMAYDAARERVVLSGGAWGEGLNMWTHGDTWEWDGTAWVAPQSTPLFVGSHAMTSGHQTIVFGGANIVIWEGMPILQQLLDGTWGLASVSPTAFTTFGTGCPGTAGTPTLDAASFSSPWTGDIFSIELSNLPPGATTFMVTGLSNTFWAGALIPLPAPLTSWGMPGCTVYTDVVHSELLVNTSGSATWSKVIPNSPLLVGLTFYNQGFVIDPGLNAMGATVSNAGAATIGMR